MVLELVEHPMRIELIGGEHRLAWDRSLVRFRRERRNVSFLYGDAIELARIVTAWPER
jgi:hypothetical protein